MSKNNLVAISALILSTALFASCLGTLPPAECKSTLPTPQFTVAYKDQSFTIPAHNETDSYNGKTIQISDQYVENKTVEFSIQNQQVESGYLYFVIQMKGAYAKDWTQIALGRADDEDSRAYTLWEFHTGHSGSSSEPGYLVSSQGSFYVPQDGTVEFQVKAEAIGEVMAQTTATNPFGGSITTVFAESPWSQTRTIQIEAAQPEQTEASIQPSQTPNTTPAENKSTGPFDALWLEAAVSVLALAVAVLGVAVVLLWRKVAAKPPANV